MLKLELSWAEKKRARIHLTLSIYFENAKNFGNLDFSPIRRLTILAVTLIGSKSFSRYSNEDAF
jgi:hypothetical protein